jgi:organic radical activating enzyme
MDYYCSAKFTDLQVHVQGRLLYNCCKAYPERVDIDWLEANPGKLFHTDTMLEDRRLMLENKSCASCHHGCYKYEEQGLSSERQQYQNSKHISNPHAPLKDLKISLSTECNLTCIYCSPEWSSSWYRDIEKNGNYILNGVPVKQNNNWSVLWSKMKQKTRGTESKFFKLLLSEIQINNEIETITILGGEPLLNNQLDQVLDSVKDKKIIIVTGLGVSSNRLQRILEKTKDRDIRFLVSAESTGKIFELIRYGVKWNDFQQSINMIKNNGNKITFLSTISNLSVLGFTDFYDKFHDEHEIQINNLIDTGWMMPHVLDPKSKKDFLNTSKHLHNLPQVRDILEMIDKTPDEKERVATADYLKQFSSRRAINLEFLPKNFIDWCGL